MSLSLAMVVKNEAQTIERSIMSVKEYVDEVVVGLDTTSNDGTAEIVKKLADKVLPIHLSEELAKKGPMNGGTDWGFSKARNQVFDACKEDNWRLVLDGHENIKNPERMAETVRQAGEKGCDGVEVKVHFEPADDGIPVEKFPSTRLMGPKVRYNEPIHNLAKIERLYADHGFIVEHRKRDQKIEDKVARDKQRSDANIEGLRNKLRIDGNHARSWFYLANAYKENARFREAIAAYKECLEFDKWYEQRWHARYRMAICYNYLADNDRAREQFVLALEEFPAMAEAYYQLGFMAYQQKRYREAEVWLTKCVQMPEPVCKLFIDARIYEVSRFDQLSMVYDHLRQYEKAIVMGKKALKAAPNVRIEKNIGIWEKCLKKPEVKKYDAEYYDGLWSKPEYQKPHALEIQRMAVMASAINGANQVLDVGSGPGFIMDYLPKGAKYTGVDISKVAREAIMKKGGKAASSIDKVKGKGIYDACILGEFLEHIEDDVGVLDKIGEYLFPGATIIASVPKHGVMKDPAHVRDYTEQSFEKLLSSLGKTEMLDPIGPWMLCKCVTPE